LSKYILNRLLILVFVVWIIITVTFGFLHSIPGGPFDREKNIPEEVKRNIEARYRLNDPLYKQYLDYLLNIIRLDLGPSYKYIGRSVNDLILEGFPRSALIGFLSILISLSLGIPLGSYCALKQNRWQDHFLMLTAIVGVSVPSFILASILMYFFSLKLKIFPATGWGTFKHLILPSLSLSSFSIAYIIRLIRSSMLDVLSQDYIKTAYSKGLATRTVVLKHALKNAIFPIVTYLGPLTAGILTGSFVIEKIFSIPGLGRMLVVSIGNRDYTATLGITLFYSVLLVSFNSLVDIVYMILDPRVRLSKKQMI